MATIHRTLKPYFLSSWLSCVLLCLGFYYSPPIQEFDLKLLDQNFNLQRRFALKPGNDEVVVIGIDEQTYQAFSEPFALWHRHLGDVLRALAIAKPKVVGLDISFPDRSYNAVLPDSDNQLLTGILALKSIAPLVLGVTIEQSGKARPVYPPFLSVAGVDGHAFVLWHLDSDRVIRRYQAIKDQQGNELPTLVGTMAKRLNLPVQEGLIDYTVGSKMNYVPLHEVVNAYRQNDATRLKTLFNNKLVFVGTVLPFEDRHYQPVPLTAWETSSRNHIPGVFIHAQAMRSLLAQGFITEIATPFNVLLVLLITSLWWLRLSSASSFGLLGLLLLGLGLLQFMLLQQGFYVPIAAAMLASVIILGVKRAYVSTLLLLERQRLKSVFNGYIGPQVMREILVGHLKPGVNGERKYLCVMFSDIRNFTSISEKLEPEQIINFLGLYLDVMVKAIQQHDGTIDKFMGDGIMAFFGAPARLENPCQSGFYAAKAKLTALIELNKRMADDPNFPQLQIGIGLHAGEAIVGNIGSSLRNEYTAIGDVINTGSRLEGLTKQLGYPLVVSETFLKQLGLAEPFDDLGEVPIKGRSALRVFGWPSKLIDVQE